MKNYRDLIVWQKAHKNVLQIHKLTKTLPKEEQFGITSQIRRAATSVPTNIAEGCGKFTQRDFANFLQNALGSCMEVEYLSFLSFELSFLQENEFRNLNKDINDVKAMLISLIKKVRKE